MCMNNLRPDMAVYLQGVTAHYFGRACAYVYVLVCYVISRCGCEGA